MAMGPRASQEQVDDLKRKMGLDKPLIEQYQQFIVGLSRGDLGLSFLTKRRAHDDIAETFAATFELVLATVAIAFLVGVPLGVVAAANKDGWVDNLMRLIAIFGAVTPSYLLALLLQILPATSSMSCRRQGGSRPTPPSRQASADCLRSIRC